MFGGQQDELEHLRMYGGDQDNDSSPDSSEGLDSDEETRILSALNYQSTFDTIKSLPNQTAAPLLNGNPKRTDQDEQDENALTSGNEVEMKETEASSDSDMEMSSSNGSTQSVANFIDMNVQNGVQEEPIETNPIERVRKLQTLVNSRIEETRLDPRKPERLCLICFFPGHNMVDCKRCASCGGPKHPSYTCNGLDYCKRCKRRGHDSKHCEKRRRDKGCSACKSDYHRSQECPSLLHRYNSVVPPTQSGISYCYRCSDYGHFGDECPKLPPQLALCPSAFSKYNEGDLERYSPSHMKIFLRHSNSSSESERDCSRTRSRRKHRSSSDSKSPKRRRERSRDRKNSRSSSQHNKTDSKDRSKSHSSRAHSKSQSSKDHSKSQSSKASEKQESSSSTAQINIDNSRIIYISDDDSKSGDSSIELLENKRESSVDSRASSIERARGRKESRA